MLVNRKKTSTLENRQMLYWVFFFSFFFAIISEKSREQKQMLIFPMFRLSNANQPVFYDFLELKFNNFIILP